MEKAIAVDPTVYEYDNIYDDLQAKKAGSDKRLASDVDRKVINTLSYHTIFTAKLKFLCLALELACEYFSVCFMHSHYDAF